MHWHGRVKYKTGIINYTRKPPGQKFKIAHPVVSNGKGFIKRYLLQLEKKTRTVIIFGVAYIATRQSVRANRG